MCGIAGVLSERAEAASLVPAVRAMLAAARHRGPDGEGAWLAAAGHAAFAHTRLSIIDLSAAGHQPMSSTDGRFTITFNGEIYNHQELRRSLEQRGFRFTSRSDTEVILQGYAADGLTSIARLRGMFAFAIWDERERVCVLARDPFGIKPLYYHNNCGRLTFASELRTLVASGLVPAALDATGLYGYFRTGSVPEPGTMLRGVTCLEPGSYAVWREGSLSYQRYWNICFSEAHQDANGDASRVRAALVDSIDHHFVSDVPVGVFLSGGIDSSSLVALARARSDGELRTFSMSFPGSSVDEGPDARRTADHFKTKHHDWALDGATARHLFDEFLAAVDQPSIDGFNTFTVCRLAGQHGTKVVLSGLGGDELFGGYPSFRKVPRLAKLRQIAQFAGPLGAVAARTAGRVGGSRFRRLGDLMSSPATLENAYAVFRGIYSREEAQVLTAHYAGERPVLDRDRAPAAADPTAQDSISRLELTRYMRNQLLRDSDVMSMASGVELRVPFIDSVLFDNLAQLPAHQRLRPGKALLIQAVPELPSWVVNRPKRGFTLPIEQWLQRDWAGSITQFAAPAGVKLDTWYRKWSVLALERWLQRLRPHHA